ncbi:Nucleoporin nup84 [Neophaeococcomyces mojaviensis]|uniref:Nucleoporin nup84 n=1 Tax=Neophaeococcomyces mojaviensis TaxID=3383035 RepID=A0ACC3A707_9EURO|nr:Nucleoporin nup84 [Knufia sp. JES_112]
MPAQSERVEVEDDEGMESDHDLISSEMEEDMMEDNEPKESTAPLQSSASELLRPLQETADRVSRQMEEFSQALDEFKLKKEASAQDLWEETWVLMDKYAAIATRRAEEVASKSPRSKAAQKNRKSLGDTTRQVENLHLEHELWATTTELLACKNPDLILDTRFKQNTGLVELHRYTTNAELWKAFLEVDLLAQQYDILLGKLMQWCRETSPELSEENLESYSKAQRGDGVWSSGHIYTKEAIKKQKITRSHEGVLDKENPAVRKTHVRAADNTPLVTQMDPDAPLREDASLPIEDEFYEDSAWYACWQFLRRGYTVEDCRNWCQERNELWRSLVFRNSDGNPNPPEDKRMQRIINLASNPEYAAYCRNLGESEACDSKYENAVLGIMGGSYTAAAPACKSVDDYLFSLINGLLIERYEQFLSEYRRKVKDPSLVTYRPQPSNIGQILEYVQAAQTNNATRAEAHQPHKYLECVIVADDFTQFFLDMGHAAAKMAHLTGQSKALFDQNKTEVGECAQIAAQDEDLIRITAHLQLALRNLGLLDQAYDRDQTAMDNNIINYIGLLQRHGKYSLMPLYASHMSANRIPHVLGRVLSHVTIPKERDFQMRLMKHYNIPGNKVIYRICDYSRKTWAAQFDDGNAQPQLTRVTEYSDKIVRMRAEFIGEVGDHEELELVQSHEWINYVETKDWGMAVWLMTSLYRSLLLNGRVAAAKLLSKKVELEKTSLKVTGMKLSLAAIVQEDLSDGNDTDMEGEAPTNETTRVVSPTKRRKDQKEANSHPLARESTSRTELTEKSLAWAHLEHLVRAMVQLEEWQIVADKVDAVPRSDVRRMKAVKNELRQKLQQVHDCMQPLLEQDFLQYSTDEEEKEDLRLIRNHYLPECVLGYNSALYFAGFAISRQHLVQCMDLAQEVAQNDSLTQTFVASKRMQELVTAFALDSQALLRSNEAGGTSTRSRGGKRSSTGADGKGRADIWQVQWNADAGK